jgi:hypothetical protein
MTLKELLSTCNYKTIFNLIYKKHLKSKSNTEVRKFDLGFYSAWMELLSIKPQSARHAYNLYINELEDDLDEDSEPIIDITLRDVDKDELYALDFCKWSEIIDIQIENATSLNRNEILSEILWEITFWGFSQQRISSEQKKIQDSATSEWKDIEKDLGNL